MSNLNNLGRLMEIKVKQQAEKPSGCTFVVKATSEGGDDECDTAKTVYRAELGKIELKLEAQKITIKLSKMIREDNHVGGTQTFKCETAEPFTDEQLLWLNKFVGHEMGFKWKGIQSEMNFGDKPLTKIA